MPPSQIELSQIIFNMELTYLSSETSIYVDCMKHEHDTLCIDIVS